METTNIITDNSEAITGLVVSIVCLIIRFFEKKKICKNETK